MKRLETIVRNVHNVAVAASRLIPGQAVTVTGDERSSPAKRILHGIMTGFRIGIDGRLRVDLNLAGGYNATLNADEVRIDCEAVSS